MITREMLEARIQQSIEQRDRFVEEANRTIARVNGAIEAYQSLLNELVAQDTTDDEEAR
jgi:hypothetical protein